MQCSNCQFENMPGVNTCGRCGASLQLAALAIDVHPPRASPAAKALRRWLPMLWLRNQLRGVLSAMLAARKMLRWPSGWPAPRLLLRTIVPGWAHWYLGRTRRALWVFGWYLAFLLAGLLLLGTSLGWTLLILAVFLHAVSIADIVGRAP